MSRTDNNNRSWKTVREKKQRFGEIERDRAAPGSSVGPVRRPRRPVNIEARPRRLTPGDRRREGEDRRNPESLGLPAPSLQWAGASKKMSECRGRFRTTATFADIAAAMFHLRARNHAGTST